VSRTDFALQITDTPAVGALMEVEFVAARSLEPQFIAPGFEGTIYCPNRAIDTIALDFDIAWC
jgi:hypothetical protein